MFVNTMLKRTEERSGHNAAIYALRPAPGGFYSAAADGFLVHWHREDVDLGHLVARVEGGKFLCLATLADGGLVAGALDGGVHWLYPGAEDRNRHVAHHTRGTFAALRVGEEVFTGGGDGVLTRWNALTGRTAESLPLSPNSLRCLYHWAAEDLLLVGASDGVVYAVDRKTFVLRERFVANEPSVFCVAAVPGQPQTFVSGGRDAQLLVHRLGGGGEHEPLPAHLATVNALAYDPTGRYLATASRDKTVKLWDAASLGLLKVCEVVRDRGHVNSVNTLLWLDERTLVTAGDDRRILTWALAD